MCLSVAVVAFIILGRGGGGGAWKRRQPLRIYFESVDT